MRWLEFGASERAADTPRFVLESGDPDADAGRALGRRSLSRSLVGATPSSMDLTCEMLPVMRGFGVQTLMAHIVPGQRSVEDRQEPELAEKRV